jgi:hypothetical protein
METKNLPELETPCERCDCSGQVLREGRKERCPACDGAGFLPTAFGERVLDLLRHNFRPMLADASD